MWILLSLASAFVTATAAAVTKVILRSKDPYLVGWLRLVIVTPFLLCLLFWSGLPSLDPVFFGTVAILLPFELIAYLLFLKAIKISPLSLTMPFMSITPVFMILSTRLILGEKLSHTGIAGIVLVALGAYMLNLDTKDFDLIKPIRAILREKGSVYMIIAAVIYSVTAVLGKVAMEHSSPLFLSAIYSPALACALVPFMLYRYRQGLLSFRFSASDKWLLILLGVVFAFAVITHFAAISISNVAYMIAIKRLSMVFAVIYGWLIFKEKNIINRLLATGVMLLGVILVALA